MNTQNPYQQLEMTTKVTQKTLADPHIDITFANKQTIRFTTGHQAQFAQALKLGETITITYTRNNL